MSSKTLYSFIKKRVDENKSRLFLQKRDGWSWKQITWLDFQTEVRSIASFLFDFGFSQGEKVVVISPSSLECLCAECAIFSLGGISIPISVEEGEENLISVFNDSSPRIIFVEDEKTLNILTSSKVNLDGVEKIFVFEDYKGEIDNKIVSYANVVKFGFLKSKKLKDDIENISSNLSPDITTFSFYNFNGGNRLETKQISQEMFIKLLQVTIKKLKFITKEDQFYSFLPSSSSFSKFANFLPVYIGNRGAIAGNKKDFFSDVLEVMPTIMFLSKEILQELNGYEDINGSIKKFFGGRLKYIFTDSFPGHEIKNMFISSGVSIIELNELTTYNN